MAVIPAVQNQIQKKDGWKFKASQVYIGRLYIENTKTKNVNRCLFSFVCCSPSIKNTALPLEEVSGHHSSLLC